MTLQTTDSEYIVAKYAELPVTGFSKSYLVQIIEPIELIPKEISLDYADWLLYGDVVLERAVDKLYFDQFGDGNKEYYPDNIGCPKGVKLIECDLLVPKSLQKSE